MKLSFVEMSGFRGYREKIRIDFGSDVTIIDGRNGVGKSTIFDAVEFALTGSIAKYQDAKANRENVDDYIWWLGSAAGPDERYVAVGFNDDGRDVVVTRTSLQPSTAENLEIVVQGLFDEGTAPKAALSQLCKSTIIRDELIAALSMDLKETDRYALLSSAIGATGAEDWIAKAKDIYETSKVEKKAALEKSEQAKQEATRAQIALDQVRSRSHNDRQLRDAISGLEEILGQRLLPEEAFAIAQQNLSQFKLKQTDLRKVLQAVRQKSEAAASFEAEATNLDNLNDHMEELAQEAAGFRKELSLFDLSEMSNKLASQLSGLASLGEEVGCEDETCPLCKSRISQEQYQDGIRALRATSATINRDIEKSTTLQGQVLSIESQLSTASKEAAHIEQRISHHKETMLEASQIVDTAYPDIWVTESELLERLSGLTEQIEAIGEILPNIDLTSRDASLRRSMASVDTRAREDKEAEVKLSLAEQKETDCKKLFDAVKKAANDAFNQRLERVLPLITELYSRLRPHPNFQEIDYKIRGELRGYLSFSVGKNINPQFIYSSGQRRATGLAFLVSVNLSMAWSRWSSLLLDDPVQHIDDFRSVHLAELMGQLVREKRQIICAVEDPALADLLCRKMPVFHSGAVKRITLGVNEAGHIAALREQTLSPMHSNVLLNETPEIAM